jgi:hypothetical protein
MMEVPCLQTRLTRFKDALAPITNSGLASPAAAGKAKKSVRFAIDLLESDSSSSGESSDGSGYESSSDEDDDDDDEVLVSCVWLFETIPERADIPIGCAA